MRLSSSVFGAVLAGLLFLTAPQAAIAARKPTAIQVKPSELSVINAIMHQGRRKAEDGDWKGARDSYLSVINNPNFPNLSPDTRHLAYYVLAMCELYMEEPQTAYEHIVAASRANPKDMDGKSWLFYSRIAFEAGKFEDGGDAAVRAVTQFPNEIENFSPANIVFLAGKLEKIDDGRAHYLVFLEALRAARYVPDSDFWTAEILWFDLFAIYVDRGEDAKAHAIVEELTGPATVMSRQIDKRYMRFAPAGDDAYVKAVEGDIAVSRAMMARHPDKIEAIQSLSRKLRKANRLTESLKLIDTALAKIDAASKDKPAFNDLEDYHSWTLGEQANTLFLMGRYEEALTAQRHARDVATATDGDTVSHKINLGDMLNTMGRPSEALAEVKDIDTSKSNAYGDMAAEEVRACAHAQLGDKAALAISLEYLRTHAEDGEAVLESALLCANEGDEVTRRLMKRLDNPVQRTSVLVEMQTYLPKPHPTAWQKTLDARFAAVIARIDVQSAIGKYGLVRSYPVFDNE